METRTLTPTRMNEWISSKFVGIIKGRIIAVIISTSNGYIFPFFISVDGMVGKEALVIINGLSRIVAEKMDDPISHICGWINGRIAISVARFYSQMIHGARLSSRLPDRNLDWNPELCLGMAQLFVCHNNFTHTYTYDSPLICAACARSHRK